MAMRVDMTSNEVDKQLDLLRVYPEVMTKHFRPKMFQAVNGLSKRIQPRIPRRTGAAANSFGSRVRGRGVNMYGQVGWYDRDDPWYPNVLEYGAQPHDVNSFVPSLGVYIKKHPGFTALGFMQQGLDDYQPTVESMMQQASEAVVNEMAVP